MSCVSMCLSCSVCRNVHKWMITLDNKLQNIFCICDDYVINLFVCIYEVRNETLKKLLGSSFKIILHYDILWNRLKYYTERWFK